MSTTVEAIGGAETTPPIGSSFWSRIDHWLAEPIKRHNARRREHRAKMVNTNVLETEDNSRPAITDIMLMTLFITNTF
jgi:hypothetical protein